MDDWLRRWYGSGRGFFVVIRQTDVGVVPQSRERKLGGGGDRHGRDRQRSGGRFVGEHVFVKTHVCANHNRSRCWVPQAVSLRTSLVTD